MIRQIFLDANVVIDFMNASARDHKIAYEVVRVVRKHFGKPQVSPFTFIIANYLFGKQVRNKAQHREKMQFFFEGFAFTPVTHSFAESVFGSRFTDLEDAAQYQSALQGASELIVTKNVHDFFASEIPVIHPHDFVNRYNNMLQ